MIPADCSTGPRLHGRVFADRVSHSATYQFERSPESPQRFGWSTAGLEGRRSSEPRKLNWGVHSRYSPGFGGTLRSGETILNPFFGRIHVDLGLMFQRRPSEDDENDRTSDRSRPCTACESASDSDGPDTNPCRRVAEDPREKPYG